MIPVQNISYFVALNPTALTAGATATSAIFDMQGFGYAVIEVEGVTAAAPTNSPTVLKVQTNDVNSTTGMTDDPYLVGNGPSGFPIPNVPTALGNAPYQLLEVDWRSRKRYGQVVLSPAAASSPSIRVLRYRAATSPITAAGKNVAGLATA